MFGRQMKEGVLTECVRMFRPNGGHNSARKRRKTPWHHLVDKLRNGTPGFALARRMRRVLERNILTSRLVAVLRTCTTSGANEECTSGSG
jgi:hypothetical protein